MQMLAGELVLDYSVYPRNSVNQYNVNRLAEALRAGAVLPPVKADAASKRVSDGFHRVTAALKVNGPTAQVEVELVEYESEMAFFLDSVRLNSAHGQNLSAFDTAKIKKIADQFGIPDADLSAALNLRAETLAQITAVHTAYSPTGEPVPIKNTLRHLAQKQLSPQQEAANRRAGGQKAVFYAGQLVNALEGDLVDTSDAGLMSRLRELEAKLAAFLAR